MGQVGLVGGCRACRDTILGLGHISLPGHVRFPWQLFHQIPCSFFGEVSFLGKFVFSLISCFCLASVWVGRDLFWSLLKFSLWVKSCQDGFGIFAQS